MYSGLLPKGLSEADVSSSGEEEEDSRLKAPSPGAEPDLRPPSPPASNLSYRAEAGSGCASGQTGPSTDGCLPGVPPQLWQKFKDLQREKEDQKLDQPHRKRRRKTRHQKDRTQEKDGDTEQKRECEEERGKHWEELTQYFGTNERFQPPACSRPPLKSGLEKSMESAIAEGDYAKAEELSDRLATREVCHADKPSWGGAPTMTNRANGSATTLPTKDTEATNTPPHGRGKERERPLGTPKCACPIQHTGRTSCRPFPLELMESPPPAVLK